MHITAYPDIDKLLSDLLDQMLRILGERLVGLYLYGSLVTGDFDREISDIDLLAVTSSDIDKQAFDRLERMHDDFAAKYQQWRGRIEVAYLSTAALKTFRSRISPIAIISPGEPLHIKEAGKDWLMNWWVVREQGVTLFGPAPTTLIDPISKHEFLEAVQQHAQSWSEWVNDMRDQPGQAYAILTLCRALYTSIYGEQVSKKQAALSAQQRFPEWAELIQNALAWRIGWRDQLVDPVATFPETVKFVNFAIDQVFRSGSPD
jgi:predicted nucleotidyltransferase